MSVESAPIEVSTHAAAPGDYITSLLADAGASDYGTALAGADRESNRPPPSHTPGKAEGENGDVEGDEGDENSHEPLRRKRPSQAEGEDPADDAGDAPKED